MSTSIHAYVPPPPKTKHTSSFIADPSSASPSVAACSSISLLASFYTMSVHMCVHTCISVYRYMQMYAVYLLFHRRPVLRFSLSGSLQLVSSLSKKVCIHISIHLYLDTCTCMYAHISI